MEIQGVEQATRAGSVRPTPEFRDASQRSPLDPPRLLHWLGKHAASILLILVLLFCAYLRFINLGWGLGSKLRAGWHPDEQIVVGVDGSLAANHFDTDMGRAPIPEALTWAHYNFSSYFYSSYIWHVLATDVVRSKAPAVLIYRQLSALLGVLVCFLVYQCARTFLNPYFAILATLFTGVLPLLVQDSHYARSETFVTAGTVGLLWLAMRQATRCTLLGRCLWSGMLAGFLLACKVSLAMLLFLPAVAICAFYWPELQSTVKPAVKPLALLLAGAVAGFLAGVPYILVHMQTWLGGWDHLKRQYSNPFPPYGTDPPGYCFGLIAAYFVSTFGAPLLIAAGVGLVRLIRKRQYLLLLFLLTPLAFYYLTFGFLVAFFERNLSHIAPWIALLAACGCLEIRDAASRLTTYRELRGAIIATAIVFCLWTPLLLSWRIAVLVFSGRAYDRFAQSESIIAAAYSGLPFTADELWAPKVFDHIREQLASHPDGFILRLGDPGDELSRHRIFVAQRLYPMKLLAAAPGHFADLPVCTLQMYHGENYSWYLVRP